ncbi:Peptidyl-tRNA hydrolase [Pirellulimonas nuda]|uniref:Peptidyl-tRNA hydrolase n=1 Tax=Pirellulimonas nuda TaxID=2528009 RepID=A0A518D8K6_9BACT|nr:aminoacyl-tRNA hydrolase [Pirellulimonas nuda]QDU87806.1 Peptidyl-tRNA hydrolase [Pirellulimonas nuda]
MKIVVGLGNPGRKYEGTRHNVGFDVLNLLAQRLAAPAPRVRFASLASEAGLGSERLLLLWPQTFMNLSGTAASQAASFYKADNADLLIVCDDFHLPVGKLRLRPKGSPGGQRGLENVIQRMGGDDIPRLRVGVGPAPEGWDAADFVLGRFRKEETEEMAVVLQEAADAVECWAREGPEQAMNRFN